MLKDLRNLRLPENLELLPLTLANLPPSTVWPYWGSYYRGNDKTITIEEAIKNTDSTEEFNRLKFEIAEKILEDLGVISRRKTFKPGERVIFYYSFPNKTSQIEIDSKKFTNKQWEDILQNIPLIIEKAIALTKKAKDKGLVV